MSNCLEIPRRKSNRGPERDLEEIVWMEGSLLVGLRIRGLALLATLALLFSCQPVATTPPRPTSELNHLSPNILLIGDNQYHELYGAPTFQQSAFADLFVEVALRPTQQRIFADELFGYALEHGSEDARIVIHLGDALDVSCLSEWKRFLRSMSESKAPWFMVPGNHDGFFTGNLSPDSGETSIFFRNAYGRQGWEYRCTSPPIKDGQTFEKDDFVRAYLENLGLNVSERSSDGDPPKETSLDRGGIHVRIAWKIHEANPWKSFMIQEIRLPSECPGEERCDPLVIFLIDTNEVDDRPTFPFGQVGSKGGVREDQLEILRKWALQVASTTGAFIIVGHHPYGKISNGERAIRDILRLSEAPLYVSAHTHSGYWKVHPYRKEPAFIELNVGSSLDWPVEYRSLIVEKTRGAPTQFISTRVPLTTAQGDPDGNSGGAVSCDETWAIDPKSPLSVSQQQPFLRVPYLPSLATFGWKPEQPGRETLRNALLADLRLYEHEYRHTGLHEDHIREIRTEIKRLEAEIPATNQTRMAAEVLLIGLSQENPGWSSLPDEVGRYRVCQALWAAEADSRRQKTWRSGKPLRAIDPSVGRCSIFGCGKAASNR